MVANLRAAQQRGKHDPYVTDYADVKELQKITAEQE